MAALGSTRNPDIPTLVCWAVVMAEERNMEQAGVKFICLKSEKLGNLYVTDGLSGLWHFKKL